MSELAAGKVAVVMPALNAAQTVDSVVEAIPRDWVDEVIVVDDASTDETLRVARELDVHRRLAPPQRRLRRQPEDLLPAGAAATRPRSS